MISTISAFLKRQTGRQDVFIVLNCLIAVVGCLRISYAMHWGPWAFSDSATYFSAARNLIAGTGMVISKAGGGKDIYQLFPPLYPILLGATGWLSGNLFTAARWINILAFGFFLYLSGKILFDMTGHTLVSLLTPILMIVSPMMMADFTGAMTEPLFFAGMMLTILLLQKLVKKPGKITLMAFILMNSLLPVIRYAGIAFVAVHFLLLILFINKPLKQRILHSSFFTLMSSIPIAIWFLYLYPLTGRVGGRRFQLAPFLSNLQYGFSEIYALFKTFLPYDGAYEDVISSSLRFNLAIILFGLLVLLTSSILVNRWKHSAERTHLSAYLVMPAYALSFFLFIAISFSISNRSYVIDHRQLSPLIPLVIMTTMSSFYHILSRTKLLTRNLAIICCMVVYGLIFRYYFYSSRTLVRSLHEDGYGYTARQYQESGILQAIREIPEDRIIISNLSGLVLLHDNRLPMQIDHFTSHMFGSKDTYGEKTFRNRQAALVLIHPDFHNTYGESSRELYRALSDGLDVAYRDEIGAIYYYPQ